MSLSKQAKKARKEFRNKYGKEVEEILKLLIKGKKTTEIADRFFLMKQQNIAAYKSNLVQGRYDPYIYKVNSFEEKYDGICEY